MGRNSLAITDDEQALLNLIRTADNIALLSAEFDGERAVFIIGAFREGTEYHMMPLAMLMFGLDPRLARATLDGVPPVKVATNHDTRT